MNRNQHCRCGSDRQSRIIIDSDQNSADTVGCSRIYGQRPTKQLNQLEDVLHTAHSGMLKSCSTYRIPDIFEQRK